MHLISLTITSAPPQVTSPRGWDPCFKRTKVSISSKDVSRKYIHPHLHQVCLSLVYSPGNHLSVSFGPWSVDVSQGLGKTMLGKQVIHGQFQHLWKLSVDPLYCTAMICLETPYTWRNKYKLSELLIVGNCCCC